MSNKITGLFKKIETNEVLIPIPEGWYVKKSDSELRNLKPGEYGINSTTFHLVNWDYGFCSAGKYLPVYKIKPLEDIPFAEIIISTKDLYPEGMKIPEGYTYAGFMFVKTMFELGIKYYLSLTGRVMETQNHNNYPYLRIALKKEE